MAHATTESLDCRQRRTLERALYAEQMAWVAPEWRDADWNAAVAAGWIVDNGRTARLSSSGIWALEARCASEVRGTNGSARRSDERQLR